MDKREWQQWRRSTRTYGGGNCVDVTEAHRTSRGKHLAVYVSDSYRPYDERLVFLSGTWQAFIDRVKETA
jgi:hypothetical protein